MNRVTLGRTSTLVSELCLGTMYFGTKISSERSRQLLDLFLDLGGDFIDTANNYAWWLGGTGDESELIIGQWLKEKGCRNRIVLASKVGARPVDAANGNMNSEGLKKETIIRSVEESLSRLQTDYLDLCYTHVDLEEYPLEERMEALELLKCQGKILFKGSSNIKTERFIQSEIENCDLGYEGFQAVQQKYSVLLPKPIDQNQILKYLDEDMMSYANKHKISLLTYSLLLSGAYEKGYHHLPDDCQNNDNKNYFENLRKLALEMGFSVSQLVLRLVKLKSPQIIPIVATSTMKQLQERNCEAFDIKIPDNADIMNQIQNFYI